MTEHKMIQITEPTHRKLKTLAASMGLTLDMAIYYLIEYNQRRVNFAIERNLALDRKIEKYLQPAGCDKCEGC